MNARRCDVIVTLQVITFHEEVQPVDVYAKAWHSCQALGLPYLVAVKPASEDADRGAGTKEAPAESVVGYAYANGYRAERMGYRFASELSIFCDPAYTGCGVGSRLLGELLAILKTPSSFLAAPYSGSYPAGVEPRKVRQLISVMSVDVTGKREGKALQAFYESFGFVFVRSRPVLAVLQTTNRSREGVWSKLATSSAAGKSLQSLRHCS